MRLMKAEELRNLTVSNSTARARTEIDEVVKGINDRAKNDWLGKEEYIRTICPDIMTTDLWAEFIKELLELGYKVNEEKIATQVKIFLCISWAE